MSIVDIVLQSAPGTPNYEFVEIESPPGTSIKLGEWVQREDGFAAIRFEMPSTPEHQHQFLPWLTLPNGSSWTKCANCEDAEQQYDH